MRNLRKRFPAYYKAYDRSWRKANPEKRRAIEKRIRDKVRLIVLEHYGGKPPKCACCREKTIEFLSLDHINGGGRKERRQYGSKLCYSLIRRKFPKGYQILCHNCNQAKGYYGKCPHKK
jgi:hypothetical protein